MSKETKATHLTSFDILHIKAIPIPNPTTPKP